MAKVISINEENFTEEVLNHDGTVLVDFYSERCPPCQQMAPIIDKLATDSPEMKVVKVEAIDNADLAAEYSVNSIPTFILFENGGVTKAKSGIIPPAQLKRWVES